MKTLMWYTVFMKPKLTILLLLMFLVSCAPVETLVPEIIYVLITATPEPTPTEQQVSPEFYFNSWEIAKNSTPPASGQFWYLGVHEYMIFATSEESAQHEVGHIKNADEDYPSNNPAFQEAVDNYIFNPPADVQDELHHYLYVVIVQRGNLYDDAFAELYMWNILYELPEEFIDFY